MLLKNIVVAFALAAVGMGSPLEKRGGGGGGGGGGGSVRNGGSTNCVCSAGQQPTWCTAAVGLLGLGVLDDLCGTLLIGIIPRVLCSLPESGVADPNIQICCDSVNIIGSSSCGGCN